MLLTARCAMKRFPSATLIRLYELLKNDSRKTDPARQQAQGLLTDGIDELVEVNGIEPMTPCLQSRCSPS